MSPTRLLIALACVSPPTVAQSLTYSSYPQDTLAESTGTYASFGTNATGGGDESTFQQMVPARYLPGTGTPILGLEVAANYTGSVTYSFLQITLAHTTATSLSKTFASNLASGATVVLGGNDVTLNYVRGAWSQIAFATPFFYDGTSNLVIEIRKLIDRAKHPPQWRGHLTMQTRGNPVRFDLPQQVYDFGPFGSGVSQATTSRLGSVYPMSIRLDWGGSPTLVLKSDPGGTTPNGATFALGTSFDHTVQGRPGANYAGLFSVGFAPSPFSHPILVGLGYLDLTRTVTLLSGTVPGTGFATTTMTIPTGASLVGLHATFQSVVVEGPLKWTNAADAIVNQ